MSDLKDIRFDFARMVLLKWGWISEQAIEMSSKSVCFHHPFLCDVGRIKGRQKIDREFSILRMFMENTHDTPYGKYFYFSKNERPDFILESYGQERIGVEVTESPLHTISVKQNGARVSAEESYRDMISRDTFLNAILPILEHRYFSICIKSRPTWNILNNHAEEIKISLIEQMQEMERRSDTERGWKMKYENQQLYYSLTKNDEPLHTDISEPVTAGRIWEEHCIASIWESIRRKLEKSPPETRPTILVVYPNHRRGDIENYVVPHLILQLKKTDFNTHYDEIWIAAENCAFQING